MSVRSATFLLKPLCGLGWAPKPWRAFAIVFLQPELRLIDAGDVVHVDRVTQIYFKFVTWVRVDQREANEQNRLGSGTVPPCGIPRTLDSVIAIPYWKLTVLISVLGSRPTRSLLTPVKANVIVSCTNGTPPSPPFNDPTLFETMPKPIPSSDELPSRSVPAAPPLKLPI
jgi:hypothetical protein